MTVGGYFCDAFQTYGRHDLFWQETTEQWELWECQSCGYIKREEVEPKAAA